MTVQSFALADPPPPFVRDAPRTQYRIITGDLRTGTIYSRSLPLIISTLSRTLNASSDLSATIALNSSQAQMIDILNATTPRRTFLAVDVAGRIAWAGLIWPRDYTTQGHVLTVGASTLDSLFAHREIRDTIAITQADRFDIARALVDYAQGKDHFLLSGVGTPKQAADAGITTGTALQGSVEDLTYDGTSHQKVADALSELAAADPGFDWTVDAFYDTLGRNGITFALKLGAPLGTAAVWPFSYPGNILDYTWSEDGSSSSNDVVAIGTGEGAAQPVSTPAVAQADLDAGFPLLEDSTSYDTGSTDVLNSHAVADVAAATGERVTCTADLAYTDQFAQWSLGDTCRLRLTSYRHPALPNGAPGFDGTARMTGWDVTFPTAGQAGSIQLQLEIA